MTTRTPQLTYRTLLALPGAAAFAGAAAVGRVGVAATGLGLVGLVHGASGSFAAAGLAVAAFAAAEAVVSPHVARLVDRRGQTAVLPVVLAAHAAAVGLLLLAVGNTVPAPSSSPAPPWGRAHRSWLRCHRCAGWCSSSTTARPCPGRSPWNRW